MTKGTLLLLLVFVLAGCSRAAQASPAPASTEHTSAVVQSNKADTGTADTGTTGTPTIIVTPASGYAGTFVGVSGSGWPASAMVLVKLADEQGRSPVLTAIAADAKGKFTTGFVYPLGDRWLHSGSQTVVAHTEDGKVQATAPFTVVPPAGVIAPTSTPTAVVPTPAAAAAVVTPAITASISFTSGALAATPVATATPAPTATPTATAAPAAAVAPAVAIAPTATAVPQASHPNYGAPVSTIAALIEAINRMPASDLDPQLANSLTQKLTNAQKQVSKGHATPAANMLAAFQHEVAAQSGKHIAPNTAAFLIASADNIVAHLQQGQPGSTSAGNDDNNGNNNGKGNDKNKGKNKDNGNGKGNGKGHDKGKG